MPDEWKTRPHDWRDGLFIMICKECGQKFALYSSAEAHIATHQKKEEEED